MDVGLLSAYLFFMTEWYYFKFALFSILIQRAVIMECQKFTQIMPWHNPSKIIMRRRALLCGSL